MKMLKKIISSELPSRNNARETMKPTSVAGNKYYLEKRQRTRSDLYIYLFFFFSVHPPPVSVCVKIGWSDLDSVPGLSCQ